MTTTDNIAWSELLKHPIVTAQHSNGKNRIAAATDTVQQTAQQLVQVLNERARLLAVSAQYDAALRDSAAIRALLPVSGLGYLCMGDVHCQQGHHAAAISIYDQGLEVVPESDSYYQQLQQHRMTAITNNNKRVDFISQLPSDIVVTNIVPRMQPEFYTESSCKLLYVSRSWQNRILQQPKGLRFSFGHEANTFKNGHTQLIRFSSHVHTLSGSLLDVPLDDLFSRAHFSNLKKLDIMCDDPEIPRLTLIHGLELIADSLTHLEISGSPDLQLRDILDTCPNLVSLEIEDVDAIMPLPPSSSYPKVTHLALYSLSETARSQHDSMIDVLCRFPSLRSFEVIPTPTSSILPALRQHCPHLQILHYGLSNCSSDDIIDMRSNRKGVTLAYLGAYEEDIFRQDDLIGFLHLNMDYLEEIAFRGTIDAVNSCWILVNGQVIQLRDDQYSPFSSGDANPTQTDTSFMRLGRINFSGTEPTISGAMFTWLLSNAPNIKAISLNDSHIQPQVAKIMSKAKHLSKLEISRPHQIGEHESIIQFLQENIAMGNQSTLEELAIRTPGSVAFRAEWIPLISRLKSLKNLKLVACISQDAIPIMKTIAHGCPALERLTLGMRDGHLDDGVVSPWRYHSNLKCLRIEAESVSDHDLIALCTFRNLKQLQLVQCDVSDDLLCLLEEHIPDVDVIDDDE